MKKWLIILLIIIFIFLTIIGIFHRSIIEYVWESKVNYDRYQEDKALDKWQEKNNIQNPSEDEKLLQMCELTLYPQDCNEQPEWRENCLACEAAGLKRTASKNDTSIKTGRLASTEEEKTRAPLIKNLGINFANYNPETKKAGDFLFTLSLPKGKILGEFGEKVTDGSGNIKALPHYTYYLPKNTPVISVSDGEVIAVWYQEQTKDYEIHVKPVYDSYWDINYDHVINPYIKENDTVKASDIIAYAGDFNFAPVEISLESEKQKPGTFYPLLSYFDPSLKQEYEQKVWKLISDWETYKNNKNIYDEAAMISCPGCLSSSLPNTYT